MSIRFGQHQVISKTPHPEGRILLSVTRPESGMSYLPLNIDRDNAGDFFKLNGVSGLFMPNGLLENSPKLEIRPGAYGVFSQLLPSVDSRPDNRKKSDWPALIATFLHKNHPGQLFQRVFAMPEHHRHPLQLIISDARPVAEIPVRSFNITEGYLPLAQAQKRFREDMTTARQLFSDQWGPQKG